MILTPPIRGKRLTAQNRLKMLADFCTAHGSEQIIASYGWDHGDPRAMYRGEKCWAFYDAEMKDCVGWGSIVLNTADQSDDEAQLLVGVLPAFQRLGYRTAILDWLCVKAKNLGAAFASMTVFKDNEAHYNRTMRGGAHRGLGVAVRRGYLVPAARSRPVRPPVGRREEGVDVNERELLAFILGILVDTPIAIGSGGRCHMVSELHTKYIISEVNRLLNAPTEKPA